MAIINRLARLFKADFHAVLDHIEEPAIQLKQSVREMEEELASLVAQIQQQTRELENVADRKKGANSLLAKTNDEIAVCINNDSDDLTRGLVRRKLETIKVISALDESSQKLSKTLAALGAQHKEYLTTLESMRQKVELVSPRAGGSSCTDEAGLDRFTVSDQDVEVALLKERQQFDLKTKTK